MVDLYLFFNKLPQHNEFITVTLCPICFMKKLSRRFFASLPLKSKSFMQYAG